MSNIAEGQTTNTRGTHQTSRRSFFPFPFLLGLSPFVPFFLASPGGVIGHGLFGSILLCPRLPSFPLSCGSPSVFIPRVGGWLCSVLSPSFVLSYLLPSFYGGGRLVTVLLCPVPVFPSLVSRNLRAVVHLPGACLACIEFSCLSRVSYVNLVQCEHSTF